MPPFAAISDGDWHLGVAQTPRKGPETLRSTPELLWARFLSYLNATARCVPHVLQFDCPSQSLALELRDPLLLARVLTTRSEVGGMQSLPAIRNDSAFADVSSPISSVQWDD